MHTISQPLWRLRGMSIIQHLPRRIHKDLGITREMHHKAHAKRTIFDGPTPLKSGQPADICWHCGHVHAPKAISQVLCLHGLGLGSSGHGGRFLCTCVPCQGPERGNRFKSLFSNMIVTAIDQKLLTHLRANHHERVHAPRERQWARGVRTRAGQARALSTCSTPGPSHNALPNVGGIGSVL